MKIELQVIPVENQIRVESVHRYQNGKTRKFGQTWDSDVGVNTEYGLGLSLIHDIKDHYFWGLDISQMAEFQAICQIQVGRAMLNDPANYRTICDSAIWSEISGELYGPRWPRVYNPKSRPLLSVGEDVSSGAIIEKLKYFCFGIVIPQIADLYEKRPEILALQASIRSMPSLASHFLEGINWDSFDRQTLKLQDNLGYQRRATAYVAEEASGVTQRIYREWKDLLTSVSEPCPQWFEYEPIVMETNL
ncbi:hypothetical protein ACCS60_27885 [Rhizobium acaciae]|uniref:hypothetical protein n=1 Tax=Rhizobium acaciae TaxID=2989736 RepID=UPI003F97B4BC